MKNSIKTLVIALLFTVSYSGIAQTGVCTGFHKENCFMEGTKKDKREFMYNAQSKSGLFAQGSISKLRAVVYKGMDYRMTVCCETALGQSVNFKILDAKTNEELYDNTKDENSQQFEFQSASTRQLIIEVSIPSGETQSAKGKATDAACVGLLIEHKVAARTGFSTY
jgi:hypothetical protein